MTNMFSSNDHDVIIIDDDSVSSESHVEPMVFNTSDPDQVKKHETTLQDSIQSLQIKDDTHQLTLRERRKLLLGQCGICDDKATGVHYGLATCEGCKGFFKRTVQNEQKYQCHNDNKCVINKLERNCCRACRFGKCLAKGMIPESVRYDRRPGSLKSTYKKRISEEKNKRISSINNKLIRKSYSTNSIYQLDKLSKLNLLFDTLRPLLHQHKYLTKESIRQTSHLLIDIFINWYQTLPFYSIMNIDLNQFILNNQWSSYILFSICQFLKLNYKKTNFITYADGMERIYPYEENSILSCLSTRILHQFLYFLSKFFDINLTNTEFSLLSIIIILQTNRWTQMNLNSLRRIYVKILYTYEINVFRTEQPQRYNQLLDLSKQIHSISNLLVTNQHFYVPFLLIPNK